MPLMYTSGAVDAIDDPQTVQAVLDRGADANLRDRKGWTALMYAAEKGLTGAVRILVLAGADRDTRNKDGQTALTLARKNGHQQIVTMLSTRQP
jgi:ankyrin repeat protein